MRKITSINRGEKETLNIRTKIEEIEMEVSEYSCGDIDFIGDVSFLLAVQLTGLFDDANWFDELESGFEENLIYCIRRVK